FNDTATTEIYTLSLHDALPISVVDAGAHQIGGEAHVGGRAAWHDAAASLAEIDIEIFDLGGPRSGDGRLKTECGLAHLVIIPDGAADDGAGEVVAVRSERVAPIRMAKAAAAVDADI